MSSDGSEAAILLADITGSTPLYEAAGDAAALRQVADCVDRLRTIVRQQGGDFVRSKGDDVLCAFVEPSAALRAVRLMLSSRPGVSLGIHAGVHFGRIIRARGDIFGDAVNLTARLASLAKAGEVLISRNFVDQLPEAEVRALRVLDTITFKGRSAPTEVYSLVEDAAAPRTEVAFGRGSGHTRVRHQRARPEVTLTLRHGGLSRSCGERDSVSIGRSPECDLVIGRPWVSRRHATVSVQHGRVQLEDSSTSGTYVAMGEGEELFLRRETVLLTGAGTISPALRPLDETAEVIHFRIDRHRPDP